MPLKDLETASQRVYDVCLIGAGPAGTAAALALSEAGQSTLLIDAGELLPTSGLETDFAFPETHAPLSDSTCRAFGGTSWTWGGRIMPFAPLDFRVNDWPLVYEDYAKYLDTAAAFLGGSALEKPFFGAEDTGFFDLQAVEMLAVDGAVSQMHRTRLHKANGPDILLSTTVVGLLWEDGPDGLPCCVGVRGRLRGADGVTELKATSTVLAAGGVETTRLLLADQARHPEKLGHLSALGSYYSGHLTGCISRITFHPRTDPRPFGWRSLTAGGFDRRVFRNAAVGTDSPANMFLWAKNWPFKDPAHRSGLLSAKYLMSRMRAKPWLSRSPGTSTTVAHLQNMISDAKISLLASPGMIGAMMNRTRRNLDHLIPNRLNCYKLNYHAEQTPCPENLIALTGQVEPDQLPNIRIHYTFSDADIDAVVLGHTKLAQELEGSGLAKLTYEVAQDQLHDTVRKSARDGYHQIGSARMGENVRDSVVDGDCAVHGVQGVYIAGSSMFRSGSAAPPTHSIVAFALRLADHLSSAAQPQRRRNRVPESARTE